MLQSILWMAVVTAGVASLAAFVMTGSFLWALVAYSGSGMSVLFALLITELVFGPEPEAALDESGLASENNG